MATPIKHIPEVSYADAHTAAKFRVPSNRGYYVNRPNVTPAKKNWNGVLIVRNPKEQRTYVYLWITEIEASFSIGGSFGQSARTRTWYPRNFIGPTFRVTGQFANQASYQRLAEVVRQGHHYALGDPSYLTRLIIPKQGINTGGGTKGAYTDYNLLGYIGSIQRKTERFVFAPPFTFEMFVVSAAKGIVKIDRESAKKMQDWTGIIRQTGDFTKDPDLLQHTAENTGEILSKGFEEVSDATDRVF